MASSWARQKKIADYLRITVLISIAAVAVALVIANNAGPIRNVFSSQKGKPVAAPSTVGPADTVEPQMKVPQRGWVVLDGIEYALPARNGVAVRLSLVLWFHDKALRDELLLRREGLRVMAIRVLQGIDPGDMKTASVRTALLDALNSLVNSGKIADIEIRDYDVIEVTHL